MPAILVTPRHAARLTPGVYCRYLTTGAPEEALQTPPMRHYSPGDDTPHVSRASFFHFCPLFELWGYERIVGELGEISYYVRQRKLRLTGRYDRWPCPTSQRTLFLSNHLEQTSNPPWRSYRASLVAIRHKNKSAGLGVRNNGRHR
jgi:hypothetical protein